MLSLFGSKGRIIQAHLSPETRRLQVQYSELFHFRNLTQEWLVIFVRWFLNEPLAELSSQDDPSRSNLCEHPQTSGEIVAQDLAASQTCVQEPTQDPGSSTTPQKAVSTSYRSPRCKPEKPTMDQKGSTPQPVVTAC
jgi:hypothetical protein